MGVIVGELANDELHVMAEKGINLAIKGLREADSELSNEQARNIAVVSLFGMMTAHQAKTVIHDVKFRSTIGLKTEQHRMDKLHENIPMSLNSTMMTLERGLRRIK
jgi:hypothetical protein